MVQEGLTLLHSAKSSIANTTSLPEAKRNFQLEESEWAEELALINRRRNILERKLRDFIRFGLKLSSDKGDSWLDKILRALPEKRRNELISLSADVIMNKLFWLELEAIISKYWQTFEKTLGDKDQFKASMNILNDRPDAHAKPIDLADIALLRKHLTWLEDRISS